MQTARIAIIGAGLGGLYVSFLLEQRGSRDYMLLEARDGPCGRILSVSPSVRQVAAGAIDRFDLGPSWFWPGYQHQLDRLVRELGLARFEQFEAGDMLVEHSLHAQADARVREFAAVDAPGGRDGGADRCLASSPRCDADRRRPEGTPPSQYGPASGIG
ncbi:NAD(P)-binding protein [Pseudomonas indica]|uniref:NAD(P)-binding protein n=1 Tax=Pseudomonas indica TaxID=137658 RepID=UPI003FD2BF9E